MEPGNDSPSPAQVVTSGDSEEWNTIWESFSGEKSGFQKLFTREEPRTLTQFWQRCYFEDLIHCVRPSTGWTFLELASGRATTSLYLSVNGYQDITLVDLAPHAIEQAKRNFAEESQVMPTALVADAEHTGLNSDAFDCIYNIGVLEHFEDPTAILAESFRLLKPGGQIFMPIVPAMPFSHSLLCRMAFNPLHVFKHTAKFLLGRSRTAEQNMVRTKTGCKDYARIAKSIGYESVSCVPYNPYWKTNSDQSWIFQSIVLPVYKMHHARRVRKTVGPRLETWNSVSLCLLLTARKP